MSVPRTISSNPGQRPAVPTSSEAAVFQFVTVRTPRMSGGLPLAGTGQRTTSVATTTLSPFVGELVRLRQQGTEAEQLANITKAVQDKQQSKTFTEQKENLLSELTGLIQFGQWLGEHQPKLVIETVERAIEQLEPQLAGGETLRNVWEALVVSIIGGGQLTERANWLAALRAQHFMTHLAEAGRSAPALQQLAAVEAVLPADLFPLPQVSLAVEERPQPDEDQQLVREQTENLAQLELCENALRELRQLAAVRLEEAQNIAQPAVFSRNVGAAEGMAGLVDGADAVPLTNMAVPAPTAAEVAQAQAWEKVQRRTQYVGTASSLSTGTAQLLASIGPRTTLKISFFITQLEQRATQLALKVGQSAPAYQQVFEAGGTLWTSQPPVASARQAFVQSTGGPVLASVVGSDAYEGFYPPGASAGRIRPLGIADLNRVEQTLCCYKAGEVAHIENVMQGEYKERATRLLRRTEDTYSLTTEREQVQERDTVTTDRYEMAQETTRVLNQDSSLSVGVSATASYGPVTVAASSNFATASSATESDRSTAAYAKNVTDRSLQRIVERVQEQRTRTRIEEYEENNKHGLDNRGGKAHVVGVYRWVDKLYRAQVVNYGKRLMFEFMIPEPGNFHLWAMARGAEEASVMLTLPNDPRKVAITGQSILTSHEAVTTTNYAAWAAQYGAVVTPPPTTEIRVSKAINGSQNPVARNSGNNYAGALEIDIPEGYQAVSANVRNDYMSETRDGTIPGALLYVANQAYWSVARGNGGPIKGQDWNPTFVTGMVGKVPFTYLVLFSDGFICNIEVRCTPLDATVTAWKIKTFNAIMAAYQAQKDAYDQALADAKSQLAARQDGLNAIQGTNPALNQNIVQDELKKGCINWLFRGQNYGTYAVWRYGDPYNPPHYSTDAGAMADGERAKFIEQCFEWNLMTYNLYGYFWANKGRWRPLYQLNDADPLFQNFLQSGMARVLVSVRPGYEKAAMYFLSTGEIWNGGDRPGPNSPIYLSIVDELKQPVGTRVGEPWEIRVPSTLTVLQAESGAIAGKGLPCDCEPDKALGKDAVSVLTGK